MSTIIETKKNQYEDPKKNQHEGLKKFMVGSQSPNGFIYPAFCPTKKSVLNLWDKWPNPGFFFDNFDWLLEE